MGSWEFCFSSTIGTWIIKGSTFSKRTLAPLVFPPSRRPVLSPEAVHSHLRIFCQWYSFSAMSSVVNLVHEGPVASPQRLSLTWLFPTRRDHMNPIKQAKSCDPVDMARVWYDSHLVKNLSPVFCSQQSPRHMEIDMWVKAIWLELVKSIHWRKLGAYPHSSLEVLSEWYITTVISFF